MTINKADLEECKKFEVEYQTFGLVKIYVLPFFFSLPLPCVLLSFSDLTFAGFSPQTSLFLFLESLKTLPFVISQGTLQESGHNSGFMLLPGVHFWNHVSFSFGRKSKVL